MHEKSRYVVCLLQGTVCHRTGGAHGHCLQFTFITVKQAGNGTQYKMLLIQML